MITAEEQFDVAWAAASNVRGWLNSPEAAALFDAATKTPPGGLIVEVGSFCGKSATLLAASGRRVICIDPLPVGESIAKTKIDDTVVQSLTRVVAENPNVKWLRCASTEAARPTKIDMIYIDGRHKWPSPHDDFCYFQPSLYSGAMVAFHDYEAEQGVTDTVTSLEGQRVIERRTLAGSMWIGEVL